VPDKTLSLDFRLPDPLPATLPVLPLLRGAALPGGVGPLTLGRPISADAAKAAGTWSPESRTDGHVLVALQVAPGDRPTRADLAPVATLARIVDTGRGRGGAPVVVVQGLTRVSLDGAAEPGDDGVLRLGFHVDEQPWPSGLRGEGVWRALRAAVTGEAAKIIGEERARAIASLPIRRATFVDCVASALPGDPDWRRTVLQTADPLARAELVLKRIEHDQDVAEARTAVEDRIRTEAHDQRREALLRAQLKAIQDELGEGSDDRLGDLRDKLAALDLPEDVREVVDRELARLDRLREGAPERSVAVDWLERISNLPWAVNAAQDADLTALEAALEESHYGLEDVKRQVVEHLAVRQLAGSGRADVLLLVGPPGVGKTSIGQAIAEATGRPLVRVALGGVRDEAELRGHRRTYVGARPGRIVEGLTRAGAADPVILLDEVDKLGRGWQGDPGAALLEILDPEQNHAFTDHYLEVPFDLSGALFVATANDLSQLPGPLRDRMEVLHIDGYTVSEKVRIVRGHLLPRLARNAGVDEDAVVFTDAALEDAIRGWTREAGVRSLQRTLGKVYRAAAVRKARGEDGDPLQVDVDDLPTYLGRRKITEDRAAEEPALAGVARGLAWTPVGGDVLMVEAATLPGSGRLVLTGQLGDVMKESARAALTYALSRADALSIDAAKALTQDVHIHVPAGGVPKDGPSAGVTMFTALTSLLTGRPVRADVAMTGEATLRGRVLPVGGIKAKVLAAHRAGAKRVILPRRNGPDLDDVPAQARDELEFVLVDHMDEVLEAALTPAAPAAANGSPDAVAVA
jgi:ATP-dependent Lon protease